MYKGGFYSEGTVVTLYQKTKLSTNQSQRAIVTKVRLFEEITNASLLSE